MIEPCQCPLAGYCKRHQVEKNSVWHGLCQRNEKYRALWDSGNGPGQNAPDAPRGLGDTIEKMLGPVGRAYKRWRKGKCGCEQRKSFLNKVFPYSKSK